MKSKIRVRLVWRLVLCLFGHLTLLLILAIYLELSLNSVRSYTPVARAGDMQLASLDTIPAQLDTLDAERHNFQANADPQISRLITGPRRKSGPSSTPCKTRSCPPVRRKMNGAPSPASG